MEGGQVLISILYAHAGGGDTLGNMELEREKVGKIEKKNKRKAKKQQRMRLAVWRTQSGSVIKYGD